MAVITPSRSFEGSDLTTNIFGRVIRSDVRVVNFRDDRAKEGAYFFILPPYKVDARGNGVSWRVVPVRDNFGIDVKEMFAVPTNCPVAYFASRAKQFFPDFAKVEQVIDPATNRTTKRYPAFGRQTNKVIFNVAYMAHMDLGAHVLTLPQFGGGELIEAWGRKRMPDGSPAPLLNDPAAAIPVFIQLKKGAIGQPWVVTPEPSRTYPLPMELCDSDYLYNLDDVIHYPEVGELVDKLRSFVPADIFNKCMQGYTMPDGNVLGASTQFAPPPAAVATPTPAPTLAAPAVPTPAFSAPTASIPKATIGASPAPSLPRVETAFAANPMAAGAAPKFSAEDARKFLSQRAPGV